MDQEKGILQIIHIEKFPKTRADGSPYTLTKVIDGRTRRSAATFDEFAKDWKLGDDSIEVLWVKGKPYNGQEQWLLRDPNKPAGGFGGGSGRKFGGPSGTPMIVHAYTLAIASAQMLYGPKKALKLEDIDKLARKILENLNKGLPPVTSEPASQPATPQTAPTPKPVPEKEEGFEEDEEEGADPF